MVRYTVLWRSELVDELANLWTAYHDRGRITAAADLIDAELLIDAHLKGNLLQHGQRTIACGALSVVFRVDAGDRKVFVEEIWLTESN